MRHSWLPWIVLAASLLLSVLALWAVSESSRTRDEARFANAVQTVSDRIASDLETYTALVQGGTGLFATEGTLTRANFRWFANSLDLRRRYPGIQGYGFSQRIQTSSADSVEAAIRAQGVSEFRFWPRSGAVEQHAILYLEPEDVRNRKALGYNMFSGAARRAAMARARDTGKPAMTAKVELVQELSTDTKKQSGFLIYVPVYQHGRPSATLAARRANLHGFVYAAFRADDLFESIVTSEVRPRAAFRVFDGPHATEAALLHDSRSIGIEPAAPTVFADTTRLQVAGQTWTIALAATDYFSYSGFDFVLAFGLFCLLLSLLLFFLMRFQVASEQAARTAEQRLREVLEALPAGIFVADRTGEIVFANTASRRIWGRPESAPDPSAAPAPWPGQKARDTLALQDALRGVSVENRVLDIETLDHTRKTLLHTAFPLHDADGAVERAVAVVVDITEQKRAEAALRAREREFATMANSIPQLAWMTDATGYTIWYNDRWYAYTGTTYADVEGWKWQQVHHPDHLARVVEKFEKALESGTLWEDTFPLRRHDGVYRWFLSRAMPIKDEKGEIVRWLGTNTDVTEQMQAREAEGKAIREQAARQAAEEREEQIRLVAAELQRSNRELQDFAYVASHDLQEPLRRISAFADLLRLDYGSALDEQAQHYMGRIQNSALRMSQLIRDLLAFSRIATKATPLEPVDLNVTLGNVVADMDIRLAETGGCIEVDTLPTVQADPTQMHQLFQNLIGNALKFYRPGVPLRVQVRCYMEDPATPSSRSFYRITVEDNGIGFDTRYLDRIFTPFQRLHTKAEYEGTGIGLAICRRIVERLRGTLTAESTPGSGSTFILRLPLLPASEPPADLIDMQQDSENAPTT